MRIWGSAVAALAAVVGALGAAVPSVAADPASPVLKLLNPVAQAGASMSKPPAPLPVETRQAAATPPDAAPVPAPPSAAARVVHRIAPQPVPAVAPATPVYVEATPPPVVEAEPEVMPTPVAVATPVTAAPAPHAMPTVATAIVAKPLATPTGVTDPSAAPPSAVGEPAPAPEPEPTLAIDIDLTSQSMTVAEQGGASHVWPISSARSGYRTPTGVFKPAWMAKMWYSRQYDWSPMPHAIFFHRGVAIHATYATGMLGRPASHGCVRLSPTNAAKLYRLVSAHGKEMTKIVVHGAPQHRAPAFAERRPIGQQRYVIRRPARALPAPPVARYPGYAAYQQRGYYGQRPPRGLFTPAPPPGYAQRRPRGYYGGGGF